MKHLSDYMQDAQTELFSRLGVFFAFSQSQLDEKKQDGVEYVGMGSGMVVPKGSEQEVFDSLEAIYESAVKQDIAENGIDGIIDRELQNHECYYTHDIDDCVDAVEGHGITRDQVKAVYIRERDKHDNY